MEREKTGWKKSFNAKSICKEEIVKLCSVSSIRYPNEQVICLTPSTSSMLASSISLGQEKKINKPSMLAVGPVVKRLGSGGRQFELIRHYTTVLNGCSSESAGIWTFDPIKRWGKWKNQVLRRRFWDDSRGNKEFAGEWVWIFIVHNIFHILIIETWSYFFSTISISDLVRLDFGSYPTYLTLLESSKSTLPG